MTNLNYRMHRSALYSVLWLLLMMTSACTIRTDLHQHFWTMDVNSYMNYRKHAVSHHSLTTLPCKRIDKVRDFRFGDLLFADNATDTLLAPGGWDKHISFLYEDEARTGKAGVEVIETNPAGSPRNATIVNTLTSLLGTNADRYTDGKDSICIWMNQPANGQAVVLSQVYSHCLPHSGPAVGCITSRLLMIKRSVLIPGTATTAFDKAVNIPGKHKYTVSGVQ